MKLLEVLNIINESQFLIERDILNAQELKQWAQASAQRVQHPQAQTWYASQLYKFLINRYQEGARPLTSVGDIPADAPEWLIAKLQAGEPVLNIEPQQELRQQAEGVIDWLNAETPSNLRMTWEDAVEEQLEWHSESKRASRVTSLTPEQMEGLVTVKEYADGFSWVDVQTEVCLKHEGTMMGHCVGQGGYTQGVSDSTTKIISLRDAKGLAHATIEGESKNPIVITKELMDQNANQMDLFDKVEAINLSNMDVHQIKGKENKGVPSKYRDYVQDFLTQFQIEKFTENGLSDLENSGLYKLRKGGFGTVEQVGKKAIDNSDGTSWWRVGSEDVDLRNYRTSLHAKWPLLDKGGRGMGAGIEERKGIITQLLFDQFAQNVDKTKYKEHVKNLFAQDVAPGDHVQGNLSNFGLAVGFEGGNVGEPQEVGKKIADIDAGTIYQTKAMLPHIIDGPESYWLMQGDRIVSRFWIRIEAGVGMLKFTDFGFRNAPYGIPGGSMTQFLDDMGKIYGTPIRRVGIRDSTLDVEDLTWTPGSDDEKVMEQDDVSYYVEQVGMMEEGNEIIRAIDSHGHLLFIMDTGHPSFSPMMVSDAKIAGFYAIYLIEDMNMDIGSYTQYNAMAREILDETDWFKSEQYNGDWRVIDENYPILFTVMQTDTSDNTELERDAEETTIETFWSETGLDGSGMESDSFAGEYDKVYDGGTIYWGDEYEPEDEDDTRASTDYRAEGNGDANTVTHPISGGTMRVSA